MRLMFTIDVELSPVHHRARPGDVGDNARRAYYGGARGRWGLLDQLDLLGAAGLKAVCFVEALSAYVAGQAQLTRICQEIQERGHEVQLHTHPEWLRMSDDADLRALGATGMAELDLAAQTRVIALGLQSLREAGVRGVVAHRAGGFLANADTLRACAANALTFDSSYNQTYAGSGCAIALCGNPAVPQRVDGVWCVPVANLVTAAGGRRHLQICAVSSAEMRAGLAAARAAGWPVAVMLSHSFELLTRDRTRPNLILVRRFRTCVADWAAGDCRTVGFADLDPGALAATTAAPGAAPGKVARIGRLATAGRLLSQAAQRLLETRIGGEQPR